MERQWLRADEAAHQARLIVEAAQGKYEQGREGDASILVGAAKVILDRYAEDGSDEH